MNVEQEWDSFWEGLTPESEIQMKDFYGGRQWILKHTPRFGKVVEAGCGLGRYVLYLSKLGVDIEGLDFHTPTVAYLLEWSKRNGFNCNFRTGDVLNLPYESNSISGYLSFGVVEHFVEGPRKALAEVYRVLRPGGVAIITTPSMNPLQYYFRLRRRCIDLAKRVVGRPVAKRQFFQYWYSPGRLASFVNDSKLRVTLYGGGDLLYCLYELGFPPKNNLIARTLGRLENTSLARFGAQSFTISIKPGDPMFCFLCGRQNVEARMLDEFYLPICRECARSKAAGHYRHGNKPSFHDAWEFQPPVVKPEGRKCGYCGEAYETDDLFEDYGFAKPVCEKCLRKPQVNIEVCNRFLKPVWRRRGVTSAASGGR